MNKCMKVFLVFLLMLSVICTSALASGNVSFSFTNTTTDQWGTSDSTTAEGQKWDVRIDTISNYGVGRVFEAGTYNWGSGLYTYGPSSYGWRPAKKYDGVSHGDTIVWRMRQDTDYSSAFSCSGLFRP